MFILSSLAQADSSTVDENLWSFGMIVPWEFTYVHQDDGGGAVIYPFYGMGAYADYNNIEWSLYAEVANFNSKSLNTHMSYYYGSSLLYGFNEHIKVGTYINKIELLYKTISSNYEESGEIFNYGLKMVYNPNKPKAPNEKRKFQLNYTFSLGYLDGTDVTAYESRRKYIDGRMQSVKINTNPNLSGYTFSLGFMSKY